MIRAIFISDYLSRRRPVLVRGGVQAWVDGLRWSRENITRLLRASKVSNILLFFREHLQTTLNLAVQQRGSSSLDNDDPAATVPVESACT